jgi:bla regulator protein BlaR1
MNVLFNHMWQSTLFAAAVALAAVGLRRNSPRTRYWLWLGASVKFLIPFSLLVWTGSRMQLPPDSPSLRATTVQEISSYFAPIAMQPPPTAARAAFPWSVVLGGIWLFGVLFLIVRWFRRWRAIRNVLKQGTKVSLRFHVPALSARSEIEPGVFGIFRPVLLIPDGLADHLSPEQFDAVLAHESRHILCRDNLTAAVHICVETLFWFHPLVWWIGAKLMDERERDCDETVLRQGSQPRDYAQGIVNVCRTYVESPLSCAAGISGSDLKERIRGIMTWRASRPVTIRGKVILTGAALAMLFIPFIIGIVRAQSLPPEPAYTYGVVSIHRSAPDARGDQWEAGPQGGLRTINTTALVLLEWAYQIPEYRLMGLPAWATSEHYDVTFTPAEPEIAESRFANTTEMARRNRNWQRLQGVLRDRFHLVLREETHQLTMYALVQDRNGAKLSRTDAQNSQFHGSAGHLVATAQMIDRLPPFLEGELGRPVVDQTGLKGLFSFTLEWDPSLESTGANSPDSSPGSAGSSIVTALREQLGLRLEPKKGPVQVYVVEKIERPTEN